MPDNHYLPILPLTQCFPYLKILLFQLHFFVASLQGLHSSSRNILIIFEHFIIFLYQIYTLLRSRLWDFAVVAIFNIFSFYIYIYIDVGMSLRGALFDVYWLNF
mgnify:CR=1 FL=1